MGIEQLGEYEYAGFRYKVSRNVAGDISHVFLTVIPGQHAAAPKEKHLRAALECYLSDQKEKGKRRG